jgi:hypothetical protein
MSSGEVDTASHGRLARTCQRILAIVLSTFFADVNISYAIATWHDARADGARTGVIVLLCIVGGIPLAFATIYGILAPIIILWNSNRSALKTLGVLLVVAIIGYLPQFLWMIWGICARIFSS